MNSSQPYVPVITVVEVGNIMQYTNTGSSVLSPGDPVPMAAAFGVACPAGMEPAYPGTSFPAGIAVGATGPVVVHGVVSGPANSTQTWTQGQAIYWNATNGNFDNTSSGNTPAAYAWVAKASSVAVGQVKLYY
jgi:predicted RecA/RadA family phage recombinase